MISWKRERRKNNGSHRESLGIIKAKFTRALEKAARATTATPGERR